MRLVILAVVLATPMAAQADDVIWASPPGMTSYPPPLVITHEVSYAKQTLIADGIAAALMTAGFSQDDPLTGVTLAMSGMGTYMFGAPLVHFGNGQVGTGFKSMGLRIALPILGAKIGGYLASREVCDYSQGCEDDMTRSEIVGVAAGALAAAVIDAGYFAHKRVVEPAPTFVPMIGYGQAGYSVGLGGSF